nr:hypothetical protein GCM10023233_03990 [Brevibacterium otitidis]
MGSRMHTLQLLLAVFIGTAVGSLARWGIGEWIPAGDGRVAVLIVNLLGSFLLGLLLESLQLRQGYAADRRLQLLQRGLGTGVLGGFTTYSAFTVDAVAPLIAGAAEGMGASASGASGVGGVLGRAAGALGWGLGSVLATLIGGVLAAAFGIASARRLGPGEPVRDDSWQGEGTQGAPGDGTQAAQGEEAQGAPGASEWGRRDAQGETERARREL